MLRKKGIDLEIQNTSPKGGSKIRSKDVSIETKMLSSKKEVSFERKKLVSKQERSRRKQEVGFDLGKFASKEGS